MCAHRGRRHPPRSERAAGLRRRHPRPQPRRAAPRPPPAARRPRCRGSPGARRNARGALSPRPPGGRAAAPTRRPRRRPRGTARAPAPPVRAAAHGSAPRGADPDDGRICCTLRAPDHTSARGADSAPHDRRCFHLRYDDSVRGQGQCWPGE